MTHDLMSSWEKTIEDPAYARSQLPFSQNNRKFKKLFEKFSHTCLDDGKVPSEMLLYTSFPDRTSVHYFFLSRGELRRFCCLKYVSGGRSDMPAASRKSLRHFYQDVC